MWYQYCSTASERAVVLICQSIAVRKVLFDQTLRLEDFRISLESFSKFQEFPKKKLFNRKCSKFQAQIQMKMATPSNKFSKYLGIPPEIVLISVPFE